MTATTTPAPGPLCGVFAPLLPLLSSAPLEEDDDPPTREHVAGCAWCQQELARYMAVDEALRQGYGEAAHDNVLPFPFDLDGDDEVEDYAFTLEDTLEETMTDGTNQQPSTTARSSRWGTRKPALSPRATAFAGIAAALILAVIATTIYAKFAPQRTSAPAATKTSSAFNKIPVPNATFVSGVGFTVAPDGSFWYAESSKRSPAIGRVTPDGTNTDFPIPTDDSVRQIYIESMAVGSDSNLWISGEEDHGTTFPSFMMRMTPGGAFETIPLPADLVVGKMIAGPDSALWFTGERNPDPDTRISVVGRLTTGGHVTTFPSLSQRRSGGVLDICVGPDQAIWYTWISSLNDPATVTGRIGRISPSGQLQEYAVPYAPVAIASGSDGALWYSEAVPSTGSDGPGATTIRKGHIGRITSAGVASELPIDPNIRIGGLTAGSDGAIWYTVDGDQAGAFGRITPSGNVRTFSTNGNAAISLIASAPSVIWLLDARNNLWRYRLSA